MGARAASSSEGQVVSRGVRDAHPQVLARLNKSMTLADFENAVGSNVAMFDCGEWRAAGAGVPGKAFALTIHPERKEAEKREEEPRVRISGIEDVKARMGVKAIYGLSATPFFLRGSGYPGHLHDAAVARCPLAIARSV